MGNYSSAYEEYYKNINNKSSDNESTKNYSFNNKSRSDSFNMNTNDKSRYLTKNYLIKRVERELAGSLVLVSCFMALKYTNIKDVNNFYILCKQALASELNYDQSIEAFNSIEIGDFKTRDIRIGNFKIEDLKYENVKQNMENFKVYLSTLNKES